MSTLETYLKLAECARKDASLLKNHAGTVDTFLSKRLKENIDLLCDLENAGVPPGFIREEMNDIEAENELIKHALSVYPFTNVRPCEGL